MTANSPWRKSSHSSSGAQCVEVATADSVLVRDTTDRAGYTLSVPASAWATFVGGLRKAQLAAEKHEGKTRAMAGPGFSAFGLDLV